LPLLKFQPSYKTLRTQRRILSVSHIYLATTSFLTNSQVLICVNTAKLAGFHRAQTENMYLPDQQHSASVFDM